MLVPSSQSLMEMEMDNHWKVVEKDTSCLASRGIEVLDRKNIS